MRTVQRAELLTHGVFNDLVDEVDLSDCTVENLAAAVDSSVFGIRTFRRVEGRVVVDGKSVQVTSGTFDRSGTMYIDGQVMTAEELKKNLPYNLPLLLDVERHGWELLKREPVVSSHLDKAIRISFWLISNRSKVSHRMWLTNAIYKWPSS